MSPTLSNFNPTEKVPRRGLSEEEAAHYLGISRASLRQGRMEGRRNGRIPPPPFVRLGRKILYIREDLDRYLAENRVTVG